MEQNLLWYIKNFNQIPEYRQERLIEEINYLESCSYKEIFIKFANVSNSLKRRNIYFYFGSPFSYFSIAYYMGIIEYDPIDFDINFNHILLESTMLYPSIAIYIQLDKYHEVLDVLKSKLKGALKFRLNINKRFQVPSQISYIIDSSKLNNKHNKKQIQTIDLEEYDSDYYKTTDLQLDISTNELINSLVYKLKKLNLYYYDALLSKDSKGKDNGDRDFGMFQMRLYFESLTKYRLANGIDVSEQGIKRSKSLFYQPEFISDIFQKVLEEYVSKVYSDTTEREFIGRAYVDRSKDIILFKEHFILFLENLLNYNSFQAARTLNSLNRGKPVKMEKIKNRILEFNKYKLTAEQIEVLVSYINYAKNLVLNRGAYIPLMAQEYKKWCTD